MHGIPVDEQRLRLAAQHCLTYGYEHQAGEILAMPDIHIWLPEEVRLNLIRLVYAEK
jgi:hypothetical protein